MPSYIDEQRCRGIDAVEMRDGPVMRGLRKLG